MSVASFLSVAPAVVDSGNAVPSGHIIQNVHSTMGFIFVGIGLPHTGILFENVNV